MAFYYVKSGGTATGDAGRNATKQTGTFAALGTANHYDNIVAAEAATTTPTAGDFILVSDAHSHTYAGAVNYTGVVSGASFVVLAVSDTAIDAARGANRAVEKSGSSSDIIFAGSYYAQGIEFTAGNDMSLGSASVNATALFEDCKIIVPGSNDRISPNRDGCMFRLIDCEVALNNAGASFRINAGGRIEMFGGSVTTTSAGITDLIAGSASVGGASGEYIGVDLTAVTGTLVNEMGASSSSDDGINILFDRCKLASGVALVGEALNGLNQRVTVMRSSTASSDAEYQLFIEDFGGELNDDDVIRRADDEPFTDSATDISYKIVTNAQCDRSTPFWFDFPTIRWSALSAGATDTLRFFIASTATLTKNDIWIELIYPDGTNKQTPNFISTKEFILDTGTTLTTDSASDWRNGASALASHNEHQLDIDTSGDVGTDSYPIARIYIGKASITVQIASEFDLV